MTLLNKYTAGILTLVLMSCVDGRQGNYYKSYVDPLNADNFIPLAEGDRL